MDTITRDKLHEKLWQIRITKVAEELGINDYTLRKICDEYEIPRPKSGYWSKLKHGKNPPKKELPKRDEKYISISDYKDKEKSSVQYRVTELTKILNDEYAKEFVVPQKLKNKHPLIRGLKSELLRRGGNDGLLHTYGGEYLYVTVSKVNMSRFLRIIETFITVIELRGHSISTHWKKSKITIKGQEFDIKFIEKSNRKTISEGSWDRTTLIPSGKLSIRSRVMWNDKVWNDGYDKLEVQLPKIVAYLEVKADDEIQRKIQWEINRKEQERLRKIEERKQAMIQWEDDKKDILLKDAQKWVKVSNLRMFLSELRQNNLDSSSLKSKEWMEWAEKVLEERDFLESGLENYILKYEFPSSKFDS